MLAREASCAVRNRSRLLNALVAPGLVYPSISCRVSMHMNRIAARRTLRGEFVQQCPQFLCNVGLSKEQPSHPALPLCSELSLRLRVLTTACQKILASLVKFTSHGVSPLRGDLPPDGYDSVTCALPGIRGHERDDCCASSARKGCYLWIHQCPPALSGGFVALNETTSYLPRGKIRHRVPARSLRKGGIVHGSPLALPPARSAACGGPRAAWLRPGGGCPGTRGA